MTLADIIKERDEKYGGFVNVALVSREIKNAMRLSPGWQRLTSAQAEALEMIAHKIARILCGDPDYADSWVDVAGFATLVANMLEGE